MTAYVTVPVSTVENALKVPNGALRYNPPLSSDEIHALYAKAGIRSDLTGAAPTDAEGKATASSPGGAAAPRPARAESAVVWRLLADGSIAPVQIALGLTDHAYTEVTQVITGQLAGG